MMTLLIEKIKSPSYIMDDGTEVFTSKFGREYTKKISWFDKIFGVTNPCQEIPLGQYMMGADLALGYESFRPVVGIISATAGLGKTNILQNIGRLQREPDVIEFGLEQSFSVDRFKEVFIVDYPTKLK